MTGKSEPEQVADITLKLVPLDALASLALRPVDDESSTLATPVGISVAPPNMVVTASAPDADGRAVPGDTGLRLAADQRIDLQRRLRRADATGAPGEIVEVELEDDTTETLLVLGIGDGSPAAARTAGIRLAGKLAGADVVLADVTASMSLAALRAFCEGVLLSSYRFLRKSVPASHKAVELQLAVAGLPSAQAVVDVTTATSRAVMFARDLANTPSNEKNPDWLVQQATEVAQNAGLRLRVFDDEALERGGFGGLMAVGGGSASPPRLVSLEHRGDPASPRVVIVGKGITFDSGGLSLKPADSMPTMKTDMSGAAAVLAVMSTLRDLGVQNTVIGLLACAENMPSGSAYRPGDVVKHYGGRTSEILNTDAEGRLVLADALSYASARLRPDVIVDIATLTGAATLGLSRNYAAVFSDDAGLVKRLVAAGESSNDKLWQLPLVEEYRPYLDSPIADITHVSRGKVNGGAITAGLYLREFVGSKRWAHLDIAGPARAESTRGENPRGATGFGVRLLLHWLTSADGLW